SEHERGFQTGQWHNTPRHLDHLYSTTVSFFDTQQHLTLVFTFEHVHYVFDIKLDATHDAVAHFQNLVAHGQTFFPSRSLLVDAHDDDCVIDDIELNTNAEEFTIELFIFSLQFQSRNVSGMGVQMLQYAVDGIFIQGINGDGVHVFRFDQIDDVAHTVVAQYHGLNITFVADRKSTRLNSSHVKI